MNCTALFCLHPDESWLARAFDAGNHTYHICHSYEEAVLALNFKPVIVFCSLRFGEGQLLELMSKVHHASKPKMPFVPLLGATTSSICSLRSVIKEACLSNGADLVIDLEEMRDEMSEHEITAILAALVDTAIVTKDSCT